MQRPSNAEGVAPRARVGLPRERNGVRRDELRRDGCSGWLLGMVARDGCSEWLVGMVGRESAALPHRCVVCAAFLRSLLLRPGAFDQEGQSRSTKGNAIAYRGGPDRWNAGTLLTCLPEWALLMSAMCWTC